MNKHLKRTLLAAALACGILFAACGPKKGKDEYKEGMNYLENGDYQNAITMFDQAIALNAGEPQYYMNRAYANLKLEKLDAAQADVTAILSMDEPGADAYRCAGITAFERAEYDQAINYMAQAASLYSNKRNKDDLIRDCKLYQAESYKNSGFLNEAIGIYTELISKDENDAECFYLRGKCYAEKEDTDLALVDFEVVRALQANEMGYYVDMYTIMLEKNMTEKAQSFLESAIQIKAKSLEDTKNHAIIQYLLGNYEQAKTEFKAIAEDQRDENTWIYMGLTEQALENVDEASAYFEMALARSDNRAKIHYQLAILEINLEHYEQALKDIEDGLQEADEEMRPKLEYAKISAMEHSCDYAGALAALITYRDTYGTTDTIEHEIAWLQTRV